MSTAVILTSMAISLFITEVIEIVFAFLYGLRRKRLLLVLIVNLMTNPVVTASYYTLAFFTDIPSALIKLPLELLAVVTEWLIYRKFDTELKRPLIFSITANAISFFCGMLINLLF